MMFLPFKHTTATHTLLQKVLQPVRLSHPVRGIKKAKFQRVLDPQHTDDLPEFEYVGKSSRPDTLVFTWGVADHGGLGRPSFVRPDTSKKQTRMSYMHHPHRAEFGENHKVVDLACGYGFTVFAVKDKSGPSCYGTGLNTDSQIGMHEPRSGHPLGMLISPAPIELPVQEPDRVVKVASGRAHTVMLTNNGSVWTVGNNAYGQCGRPVIPDEDYTRQAVYHRLKALDGISVKQVECGQDTSFFLSEEGAVYSCGWGADGQTGRGHYNNEPAVGAVIGDIVGEKIVKVSCRADCALALNDNGDVFGWGNSEYHQLNSVTDEMQLHTSRKLSFSGLKKIVDIASAGTMCLLLDEEGQVYSWGFGPIGKGPNVTYSKLPTPIPSTLFGQNEITPDAKVTSVTCGINQFAVINSQGSLFTWGKNPGGCLGQRHKKDQYFPLHVCIGGQVMKVSCGVDHMAAMVKEIV
ncbi:RCC1-like G exchanging factor-like protein isoform X2 [Portunus trituberculatus]|uniref:RCC1-like G exchanging factor-like protein isoform X2 n=1 Tax=Portunus trituberculatus TaxID=210409 RepID=UPI001E1D0713|nr:RCC1-like G exchanging factor-like protein isoform X2 [Portunus trituberculatus]